MIVDDLGQRGRLVEEGEITHRYPVCWRCGTELIYRLVDEWFIGCDEIREPMIQAAREVEWTPPQYAKRMEDWLRNMGDWCISRKRYWGLPLPFYLCDDGHLTVVGSKAELLERAVGGTEGLEELHRPWIDDVVIRCGQCAGDARRVADVGDAWLDAGIVPFSTLGWHNETFVEAGYAEGAGVGVTVADLPDHAQLGEVVPGRLGVGDARADPPVVLLDALHGGRAGRPVALPAGAHVREGERRDGPPDAQVVGERDLVRGRDRGDGRRRHALDVRRPAAGPEPELRLRPGRRREEAAAHALEHVRVLRHLRRDQRLPAGGLDARRRAAGRGHAAARPLGRRPHAGARARVPRGARLPTTRPGSSGPSRPTSTTSRTGTCGCRARGSGSPTTRRRRAPPTRRSGTRSSRPCAASRP